ncbi:murein transglycosylase A [Sphingomonas sp.]|uniref:murein transglycosylase A n=1 Tax=Sphingomonas sp. TaxID=28214 RepID=UPI003B3B5D82
MRGGSIRRAGCALALAMLVAACATTPPPRPTAPVPTPTPVPTAPRPMPPVRPANPKTAAETGVAAGPAVSSLDITPDQASAALSAFKSSCRALMKRRDVSGLTEPGAWAPACTAAAAPDVNPITFFQTQFETALVGSGALFATGYYEPEIDGSRSHDPGYDVPVYKRPPDLVERDTGLAAGGPPSGKKARGRIQDGKLVPYYDRAAIDAGALAGQGLELAWAKDPVEFFFLQVQGSGRLLLPDGSVMRIGYDSQNGREYTGIGKMMRDQGLIGPGTSYATSMQGIMQYIADHPDQTRTILEANKSFVFFRELTGAGPIGAMGAPVVGHVSVAADPAFVPLGAPVWLSADRPEATGLWVAQDTGGAIKGANRVDTFWGAGVAARITAGGMSARGQMLILVPRGTLAKLRREAQEERLDAIGATSQR